MIQKRNDDLVPFFYDGFMSTNVVILWNRLRFRLNEHMFVSFIKESYSVRLGRYLFIINPSSSKNIECSLLFYRHSFNANLLCIDVVFKDACN